MSKLYDPDAIIMQLIAITIGLKITQACVL